MIKKLLFGLLLAAGFAHGQGSPLYNLCKSSISGFCEDTLSTTESITCASTGGGTTATLTGLNESPPATYIGGYGSIGGCGYLSAQNVAQGITATAGTGYAAGDFLTLAGGTVAPSTSFSASMSATGVLSITAPPSAPLRLGQVITGSGVGSAIFLMNLLTGTAAASGSTWSTNFSGTAVNSEAMTANNQTVIEILNVTPAFAAAVVSGGEYSVAPTTPASPLAIQSVSGTGGTFSPAYVGLPLTGTVTAVSGTGFTINTKAINPGSYTNLVKIGHDNGATAARAIALGPSGIYLPATQAASWSNGLPLGFGSISQITLPTTYPFTWECAGQIMSALAPMNAQLFVAYNASYTYAGFGSSIDRCVEDGDGVANYNTLLYQAFWHVIAPRYLNAVIGNERIGDGLPAADNAENIVTIDMMAHNAASVVPAGTGYIFYVAAHSSDTMLTDLFADGAIWNCVSTNGAGLLMGGQNHCYLIYGSYQYDFLATKTHCVFCIGDRPAPGMATIHVGSTLTSITDWQTYNPNTDTWNGQSGVLITKDGNNWIGSGIDGSAGAGGFWAANTANLISQPGINYATTTNRFAGTNDADQPTYSSMSFIDAVPIASLPTCNASMAGASMTVNNGVAAPVYNATVGTTGTWTQAVFCAWNGTTGNWTYH